MSSTPTGYSTMPMSRMQFLMLCAVENGASLTEATEAALGWSATHPGDDLFEQRPYTDWQAVPDPLGDRTPDTDAGSTVTVHPTRRSNVRRTTRQKPRATASATVDREAI